MTIRTAACILAIVAIGAIAAPAEISARGFVGAHALPAIGSVHAPTVHHAFHARTPFGRFRHRRFFDTGVAAYWGGYGSDGGYYESADDTVPYDAAPAGYPTAVAPPPSAGPVRERIIYVVPARPSCSTQTYKVPMESGGERSINVVRC